MVPLVLNVNSMVKHVFQIKNSITGNVSVCVKIFVHARKLSLKSYHMYFSVQ